jgi:hypothetical protein
MKFPIAIAIHGIEPHDSLRAEVIERVVGLEHYLDDILACRVLVETDSGSRLNCHYGVQVRVTLPCFEVEAGGKPVKDLGHLDPYLTVTETFDELSSRIEDFVRRRCLSCTRYVGYIRAK